VRLSEDGGDYVVSIRDDGTASVSAAGESDGAGRGLLGMRERAELLGGTFSAGRLDGGGFEVRARIPARQEQP
jgi:signal transduction histidine kinase